MSSIEPASVAQTFTALAQELVTDYDLSRYLSSLLAGAQEALGAESGGVLLADEEGTLQMVAATDEGTRAIEMVQAHEVEGPCVEAYRTNRWILAADLTEAAQSADYAAAAAQAGYDRVYAFPLSFRGEKLGAMNLFLKGTTRASDETLAVIGGFTNMATIGIIQQRQAHRSQELIGQLRGALSSRVIIEQAKGVLAYQRDLDVSDAFELLRTYARSKNRRIHEVAGLIVDGSLSGEDLALARPGPRKGT